MGKVLDAIRTYLIRIERSDKFLELSIMTEPKFSGGSSYGSPDTDRYFKSQNT